MKFRTGLIIGAAIGYYYGAKAGRERYEQIDRILDKVRTSGPYRTVEHRVADLAGMGKHRALEAIDHLVEEHPMAEAIDENPEEHPAELFADPRLN